MSLIVSEKCANIGLGADVIIFRGVRVRDTDPALRAEIAQEVRRIQQQFADAQAIRSTPEVGYFRDILREVGVNPRNEQPSVERLLAYALRRQDLPAINTLVDAYNLVSVRSRCSLGAHDLDRITLPVTLRMFTGAESFTPLGRTTPEAVSLKEFGYVDATGRVLCRLDL